MIKEVKSILIKSNHRSCLLDVSAYLRWHAICHHSLSFTRSLLNAGVVSLHLFNLLACFRYYGDRSPTTDATRSSRVLIDNLFNPAIAFRLRFLLWCVLTTGCKSFLSIVKRGVGLALDGSAFVLLPFTSFLIAPIDSREDRI